MQEAPTEASPGRPLASYLEAETGYPHVLHLAYDVEPDEGERPEGLALISRLPWRDLWTNWAHGATTDNNWAMKVVIETPGRRLGITNVHLDWEHPDARMRGIAAILAGVVERHPADVELLCGDFNDYEDGPVAALLEGRARFEAAEAAPWLDAVVDQVGRNAAPVTLDFAGNPRWKDAPMTGRPGRFDRIYVRSASRDRMPQVIASGLFAREPANRFGIVPSDHYGVFVDLELG
jgi:endonuclease/exonuclease/phosphatase family metal-dependent hydrolase